MPKYKEIAADLNENIRQRVEIILNDLKERKIVDSDFNFTSKIGYQTKSHGATLVRGDKLFFSLYSLSLISSNFGIDANWVIAGKSSSEKKDKLIKASKTPNKFEDELKERYFKVVDILIEKGRFQSLYELSKIYGINREQIYRMRRKPENLVQPYMIYYLLTEHNVNANWLLLGIEPIFYKQDCA